MRVISVPEEPPPFRSVLVTRVNGELRAYWNVCRHLPIPLDGGTGVLEGGEEWTCQTHGARFRTLDGLCVAGPCEGARLYKILLKTSEGRVWGDLSRPESS